MDVCDCENCSLYNADEFITRPTVTTTPAKGTRNGHKRNSNSQHPGLNSALRDSSMLARAAIIGRVTRERSEARRNSHYIPPPPAAKKKEVHLDLSKRCFLPCHKGSWLMMVSALILMAIGAGMCNFAFHADNYAKKVYLVANDTVTETNIVMYRGLRSLTYIGPCVIGVGAFLIIVACVVLFDTREKKLKKDVAQQVKIQQEINKELSYKAMLDKRPKERRGTTVVDMPPDDRVSIQHSYTEELETCLTNKPPDKRHAASGSRYTAATNLRTHSYPGKTMSAPLMPIQAVSTTESTSSNKYDSTTLVVASESSVSPSMNDKHSKKADISISNTGLELTTEQSAASNTDSEGRLYFSDKGEKNPGYEYSDYSLKASAMAAPASTPSNNDNTVVDIDRDIRVEEVVAILRPRTLTTASGRRSNDIQLHSPGDNDVEPLCPRSPSPPSPVSTELTTSL